MVDIKGAAEISHKHPVSLSSRSDCSSRSVEYGPLHSDVTFFYTYNFSCLQGILVVVDNTFMSPYFQVSSQITIYMWF